MERLVHDYLGHFGDYWKNEADKTIARAKEQMFITQEGTPRWKMGNAIPHDILTILKLSGTITEEQFKKGVAFGQKQMHDFLENYKKEHHSFSAEERAEIDANFEPGETIVNIITGEKYIAGGSR